MYYAYWYPPINDGNPRTIAMRMIEVEKECDNFGIKFERHDTMRAYSTEHGGPATEKITTLVFEDEYQLNLFLVIFPDFRRGRGR